MAEAAAAAAAKALLKEMEEWSEDAAEIQASLLASIVQRNAATEYLSRYGVEGDDPQAVVRSFKRNVPVVDYEDVAHLIRRVINGDSGPILCVDPPAQVFTSSGTSGGQHKLFLRAQGHSKTSRRYFDIAEALLWRDFPQLNGKRTLQFYYVRPSGTTPAGLPSHPALTGYYNSPEFLKDAAARYTSPAEVILCTNTEQACYCHLLCGLIRYQEVGSIGAFFASSLVRSIRSLDKLWKDLCHDVLTGSLSSRITEPVLRKAVEKMLVPNPELAATIEDVCSSSSKGDWKGIVRKLWPNAVLLDTVVTGSMQQYVSSLDHLSDGLPITSMVYASSESYFGVNINPRCHPADISYLLLPQTTYYEFIPVGSKEEDIVDLGSVKVGQEYELVITTNAGLYRYRMADVLKVAGFYNKAPLFNFAFRKNVLLSIDSDKTDERELHNAVSSALARVRATFPNARLVDYTSFADLSTNPPHYVIFWELQQQHKIDSSLMEEACLVMEDSMSVVYRRGRAEGSIGPLELILLKSGSFDAIVEKVAAAGGSIAQFKMPRCIKNQAHLEVLHSNLLCKFVSPTCPKYLVSR